MSFMASWQEGIPRGLPERPTKKVPEGKWEGTVAGLHDDGSQFTLWVVMTPQRSKDGMPIGFLAMSSDIVEGVRLTVELERTSAHAHATLEVVPDALVTVNTSDEIQLANAEAAILHGDSQTGSGRPAVEMLIADRYLDVHPGVRMAFFPESRPHLSGAGSQRSIQNQNGGAKCYVRKQVEFRRCCDVIRAMRMLWLRPDPSPRSHV
jgi:PAS domain-containing protein